MTKTANHKSNLALVILVFSILPLLSSPPSRKATVFAQENPTPTPIASDFDTAKADYLTAYDRYRQDHVNYVAAKSTYLQYRTQITKTQAILTTQTMLNSRQQVLIKYLTALKARTLASSGLTRQERQTILIDLDTHLDLLTQKAQLFNDADDLGDLVKLSKVTEKQYPKIEKSAYQALGKILVAKDRLFRQEVQSLHQLVNDQVIRARTEGYIKTQVIERWLLDVTDRLELSRLKESETLAKLSNIKDRDKPANKRKKFTQVQLLVDETHQYLKEATRLLLETIKEMKHA